MASTASTCTASTPSAHAAVISNELHALGPDKLVNAVCGVSREGACPEALVGYSLRVTFEDVDCGARNITIHGKDC
ncbi:hypothetical protein CHLRE_04g226176v5 [Chlamydomonas reinhardtii]|uniref:Pherophorin domain-containing protein n=1 Tax=Chlamydomonas reinhardtii TaxID=3055 RepID=A0A2K3DUM4_CHLRE|nr:uncharacterized protein CHLRE_04g226176v5 [Chlamydomonas reinhardtii]PNW84233.1 hypothetical protein CHLRE_04g226176v5 [Chlamydomonas reinhardtii]